MKKYLFMCFGFLASISFSVLAESIAVIVNKNNSQNEISLMELDDIYKMKMTKWKNGTQIVPINREFSETGGIRKSFTESVYEMSLNDIQEFWSAQRRQGVIPASIQQSSTGVKRMVASIDGAIGYVYANEVDNSVKVLKVDGLGPNDAGYKITD